MVRQKSCYLCGEKKFKKRRGKVRDNPDLEVMECPSCGLIFLSSFSHISKDFYESSKMHEGKKIDIKVWMQETALDDERRYHFIRRLIENKTVLDFGCGNGGFLLRAKETASHVAGIDIEKRLKFHFQKVGLKVFASIDEVTEFYDVITLFHVLEHITDPTLLLKRLTEKLNKDGQLIVEVPNANDALLKLYQNEAFSHFTYWSCHLFLFTPHTLSKLAESAGLRVNYIKQIQRYPLSNHLYWLVNGKPGGHRKWHFLDSNELHTAYEKQLASVGLCDTILGSFSKCS